MAVPKELRDELLQAIRSDLLPFYLQLGCPCAFPRFRSLVEFYHENFQAGPVGCYETELLINECFRQGRACYRPVNSVKADDPRKMYECSVCSSRYVENYQDYSIVFYVSFMQTVADRAIKAGADVAEPFPLPMGLYWLDQSDADVFRSYFQQSSVADFMRYMKETRHA